MGRPSTYAATLATLKRRGYVTLKRRQMQPTLLGEQVVAVLVNRLPDLFAVAFTAEMETALDEIAAGARQGRTYLTAFWAKAAPQFGETVIQATLTSVKKKTPDIDPALGVCPRCQAPLVARHGKHGDFVGCSAFPTCRFTQDIPDALQT